MKHWPLEPLMALARTRDGERMSMVELSKKLGYSDGTVQAWAKRGIPGDVKAEAAAVVIGFDPANVWGDTWTEAQIAAFSKRCVECNDAFVPFNAQQRFCSPQCQNRHSKRRRYRESAAERERKKAEAKRYYDECAEYIRAQKRRKYWANPQAELERNKAYRARVKAASSSPVMSHPGETVAA